MQTPGEGTLVGVLTALSVCVAVVASSTSLAEKPAPRDELRLLADDGGHLGQTAAFHPADPGGHSSAL